MNELLFIFKCDLQTKNINIANYKLLVVYYDANSLYNYYVQKFQKHSIKTATLQHGVALARRENINNLDFAGIEFGNCISDYLLAWNQFTYEEAIRSGIEKERIIIAGILRCINLPVIDNKREEKKIFGVVLDGIFTEESNLFLIQYANKLAKQLNCKYILKYHPAFDGNEYYRAIDKDCFLYTCEKNMSVFEYAKTVDFSLVANSTVFFELVYMQHCVYHYLSNYMTDKYRNIPYNSFSSFDELLKILNEKNDHTQKLFDICCSVSNIEKTYKDFFSMFE
jgi:hypothetical protein